MAPVLCKRGEQIDCMFCPISALCLIRVMPSVLQVSRDELNAKFRLPKNEIMPKKQPVLDTEEGGRGYNGTRNLVGSAVLG